MWFQSQTAKIIGLDFNLPILADADILFKQGKYPKRRTSFIFKILRVNKGFLCGGEGGRGFLARKAIFEFGLEHEAHKK